MNPDPAKSDPPKPTPPVLNYLSPMHDSRFAKLRTFNTSAEANLARSRLESEGITTQLAGGGVRATLGIYSPIGLGADLFVLQEDAERAKKILDGIDARRAARFEAESKMYVCPRCGSHDTRPFGKIGARIGVSMFFLSIVSAALWALGPFRNLSFLNPISSVLSPLAFTVYLGLIPIGIAFGRRTCLNCGKDFKPRPSQQSDDDDSDE
jgi:hypothetical protein